MQMTPEAFSRKFHQIFGCSPKQYFDKILMTRAIAHLRSDKSCAEIASLLRFSSESHFFRFINRMTGKKVRNLRQERNLVFHWTETKKVFFMSDETAYILLRYLYIHSRKIRDSWWAVNPDVCVHKRMSIALSLVSQSGKPITESGNTVPSRKLHPMRHLWCSLSGILSYGQ